MARKGIKKDVVRCRRRYRPLPHDITKEEEEEERSRGLYFIYFQFLFLFGLIKSSERKETEQDDVDGIILFLFVFLFHPVLQLKQWNDLQCVYIRGGVGLCAAGERPSSARIIYSLLFFFICKEKNCQNSLIGLIKYSFSDCCRCCRCHEMKIKKKKRVNNKEIKEVMGMHFNKKKTMSGWQWR